MSCNQKCNQGRDCDCETSTIDIQPGTSTIINIQPKDTSKGHFYVSLAKSLIRILAGGAFIYGSMYAGGVLLVVAEMLGIAEELV